MQSMRLPIVLLLAIFFLSPAVAAVNISSCGAGSLITSSDTYTLNASLSGAPNAGTTGTACIVISVGNVLIDCQGYSITHDDSANTAAILVNQTTTTLNNITIRNCNIRDYGSGILVDFNASSGNRRGVTLTNNTVASNSYGINLPLGHVDIVLSGNTIANSTVTGYNLGDYFGDSIDMTNDRLLGNGADINYTAGMSGFSLDITDALFGNAAGSYGVNTTISHPSSSRSWGVIDYVLSPAPPSANHVSFLNKSLNITPTYMDWEDDFTVTMRWTNAEAGSALQESGIQLWLINDSGSYPLNSTPDVSGNQISATVTLNDSVVSSVFALYRKTGCPIITSPGVYTLDGSLSGAPNGGSNGRDACVLIDSDDVVLDCAGYSISHDDSGNNAGIMVNGTTSNRNNITIRNCNVLDYEAGILVDSISSNRQTVNLSNNTLTSNAYGISVPLGYAYVYGRNNLVANNTAGGVYDSSYFGDILDFSQDRFLGNENDFDYPSGGSGFTLNLVDIVLGDQDGGYFTNLTLNHTTNDNTWGIIDYVSPPAHPSPAITSFLNKSFNITHDYLVTFGFDDEFGIKLKWGASEGTPLQQNAIQMWLFNESGPFLMNGTPDTVNREISVQNYLLNDDSNSTVIGLYINHGCPVVNSSGSYSQAGDFFGAPNVVNGIQNVCLLINASDVDWDCNGNTIINDGTDTSFGVYVNGPLNNVTLRNCPNVSGYVYGVYVYNSTNVAVRNSTAGEAFQSAFASVYSPALFENNLAYGSGNGFYLSDDSNISGCNATRNTNGYYMDGSLSNNILIVNNTAEHSTGYGFRATNNAGGNVFRLNRAINNSLGGFYIQSVGNNLTNNTASFQSANAGISISGSGNLVENNTAYNNSEGIRIGGSSNRISNNYVANSSGFGLITTGNTNNITSNTVIRNTYGIDVSAASGTLVESNNVSLGNYGIALYTSPSTVTRYNNVFDNAPYGFDIFNSDGVSSVQDHAYGNTYAYHIEGTGSAVGLNISNAILDRAAGDYQNYTNLSVNDSVSGSSSYTMNWSVNSTYPGTGYTSLLGKIVNISRATGAVSIDSIVWHYLESDIGVLDESIFVILKYNGSWSDTIATLDTGANTLALANMVPGSDYGIFEGAATCPIITTSGLVTQAQDYIGSPNLVSGGLACVVIDADNVDYNCNGYRITGNGSGPSTFGVISDFHKNVTIRNCAGISNYSWGIEFHSTNNSFILNNTVYNNTYYGLWLTTANPANGSNWNLVANNTLFSNNYSNIYLAGYSNNLTNNTDLGGLGNGFYIAQRGNHSISGNRFSSHGSSPALYLDNSSLNTVSGNTVLSSQYGIAVRAGSTANLVSGNNLTSNNDAGIIVQNSPLNNLSGNIVNASTLNGIVLSGSTGCRAYGNTAYGNGDYGFLLESVSSQNNLYNNTAYGNIYGFGVAASPGNNFSNNTAYGDTYGFSIAGNASTGNLFYNNSAYSHSTSGFDIMSGAFNNRFIRNRVYSNAFYGFWIETLANNNTYSDNNVSTNGRHGFFVDSSSDNAFSNNLLAGNTVSGIYTVYSSWNNITNNTATGSNNYSIAVSNGNGNRVLGNTVTSNFALAGALFFQFTSGNTIANNSVTANTNDGLYMGYTNLSTVSGNNLTGNHNGANIQYSDYNIFTDNNMSSNGANGLVLLFSVGNLVDPSVFCNNAMTGIYLLSANQTIVANNTVCNNGQYGAVMDTSYFNEFSGNNFTGNVQSGMYLLNSSENNLTSNNASGNGDHGFATAPYASFNRFVGNLASGNGQNGFSIASDGNVFLGDNATSNTMNGLVFGGPAAFNNTVSGCNASLNTGSGFYFGGCHDNSAVGSVALQNGADGFEIGGCPNSSITGSTAFGNAENGFEIGGSANTTLVGDNADSNDESGFYFSSSSDCVLRGSISGSNDDYGVYLGGSNRNNITNTNATGNGQEGFYFGGSSSNRLEGSESSSNGLSGAYLGGSLDNLLLGNRFYDNGMHGLLLSGSGNNRFEGNNVTGNNNDGFNLGGSPNCTFIGNMMSGHNYNFYAVSSSLLTLEDNTASAPSNVGFYLISSSDALIENNTASGSAGSGIFLESGSARANVTGNTVFGNAYGVALQAGADDALLRGNELFNNTQFGLYVWDVDGTESRADHYYNNVLDFEVIGTGNVTITASIFDNPDGTIARYTNLSLADAVLGGESYSIDWTDNSTYLPLPANTESFAQKFVDITALSGSPSIDNVTWSWLESELAGTYTESSFQLWRNNGTWDYLGATLDTGANTLSLSGAGSFSAFAILEYTAPESEEPFEEAPEAEYSVSIKPACNGFIVTVKDGASAVQNALVSGNDKTHGTELSGRYTNASGQVFFPDCDIDVSVKAAKGGRVGTDSGMADCGFCPECASDDDCELSEQCSSQQCVPVDCPRGVVTDHACELYECVVDADCPVGQSCIDHRCKTVYECDYGLANTTEDDNADCADNEFCEVPVGQPGGSCKPITGCGEIANHRITPWECGDTAACPACPAGELCVSNECVQADLTCPTSGIVGDRKTCKATEDQSPCVNCDYVVTDPTGKNSTGKTDAGGNLNLPLNIAGNYKIALLKDGQTLKTIFVTALPQSKPVEPEKPQTGGIEPLVLGFLLIILVGAGIIAFLYWRRRQGGKKTYGKNAGKK